MERKELMGARPAAGGTEELKRNRKWGKKAN